MPQVIHDRRVLVNDRRFSPRVSHRRERVVRASELGCPKEGCRCNGIEADTGDTKNCQNSEGFRAVVWRRRTDLRELGLLAEVAERLRMQEGLIAQSSAIVAERS